MSLSDKSEKEKLREETIRRLAEQQKLKTKEAEHKIKQKTSIKGQTLYTLRKMVEKF